MTLTQVLAYHTLPTPHPTLGLLLTMCQWAGHLVFGAVYSKAQPVKVGE